MAKVLITSEFFGKFDRAAKDMLVSAGHVVIDNPYGHKFLTPAEIIPYAREADAFICDLEKITKEVIDSAPSLKVISRRGVGVDSVDCEYAKLKGIEVAKTLGVVEAPVAELVMAYILHFSRKIAEMDTDMHKGIWEKLLSASVDGKILGIVGMGHVGAEVAKRAASFGMKIIYSGRSRNEKAEKEYGAIRVSLEELLACSDFVSVNIALTDDTRGLFDYDKICLMKPSAYLINTARGAVVNEAMLKRALEEKRIQGAAIDVFDVEPQMESIFKGMENVVLTPHIGSFTREIFIKMDIAAVQNVIRRFQS
jgi:D-3-phosphoglycerate dehydrogenase